MLLTLDEISKVFSLIDKLIKNNIIHKNKGANLKSKISKLEVNTNEKGNSKNSIGEKKNIKRKMKKNQKLMKKLR